MHGCVYARACGILYIAGSSEELLNEVFCQTALQLWMARIVMMGLGSCSNSCGQLLRLSQIARLSHLYLPVWVFWARQVCQSYLRIANTQMVSFYH